MAEEKKDVEVAEETAAKTDVIAEGIAAGTEDTDLASQVKESFLDYAMSVIVSRAIPDVRDGCKPVHRRVIFGMNETGTTPDKPFKKCARIVGDVMGKYHPHGDQAIYSTLVRLAQPFSMRHPLVEGHGNFGSVDGDEPAAMRYTEARMAKLALEMVRDIGCNTVDFVDNYDGTEKEPTVLPSRFPNLLVNGSAGIAVGMATNIPPHNLGETIDAVIAIAEDPSLTPLEIMTKYLPGPDFPTGATILGRSGIRSAYETGSGSIVLRSKAEIIEHERTGRKQIIVSEIPYQVNKAQLIATIAQLARDHIVDGVIGVHDVSNKEGMRIVIDVRRDAIPEVVLNQLYKNTQLQTSIGIIMLCLVDGAPKILPINEILKEYLRFQETVVERRTRYLLAKDEARDHIVVGLINAIANIDEIVRIIKESPTPDDAAKALMERFEFSEVQTQAILAMTLRRLTGLEEGRLLEERKELEANIARYKVILGSRSELLKVIISELRELRAKFADPRRTRISDAHATIEDEDLIPEEDIVIVLTTNNYVKRMTVDTFRTQNRGGRGVRGMATHDDDDVNLMVTTNTHTDICFFSSLGKVYRVRGYVVPEASRISKGIPIQNLLNLEKGEKIMAIVPMSEYDEEKYLFFITRNGTIKRTRASEFSSIRRNGKIAILLRDDDQLLDVKLTDGKAFIGLASAKGKMVKFRESDVRPTGRNAAGVIGMRTDGAPLIGATTSLEGENILAITSRGYGKMSSADDYRLTRRASKGVITINTTKKNGRLVALRAVSGDEDLLIATAAGVVIRIPLSQIRVYGRNTQGVRVIRLEERQRVSSISVVPHVEEDEESATEAVTAADDEERKNAAED